MVLRAAACLYAHMGTLSLACGRRSLREPGCARISTLPAPCCCGPAAQASGQQLLPPWACQSCLPSTDLSFLPVCLLGARFQCKQPLILSSPCVFSSLQPGCSPSATCHAHFGTSAPAPCSPHASPLVSASSGRSGHSPGAKAGRVRRIQLGHLSEMVSL